MNSRRALHSASPLKNSAESRLLTSSKVTTKDGATFLPHKMVWSYRDSGMNVHLDFTNLHASSMFVDSAQRVLAWYAEHCSAGHLVNLFSRLEHFCRNVQPPLNGESEVTPAHLINYRSSLSEQTKWYFGTLSVLLKRWHAQGHRGVSDEAATLLRELRTKPNKKGEAVLTMDPKHGPFHEIESADIASKLTEHYESDRISLEDYALALLYISLGQRSVQYASLKLLDFVPSTNALGHTEYVLNVPRAKQRYKPSRAEFTSRLLDELVGRVLFSHWQHIQIQHASTLPDVNQMPMFPANLSRKKEPPGFKHHRTSDSLALSVKNIIKGLGVSSIHNGEDLHISPRRFRRTIGTRAASEGHGVLVIAELLDHTDSQSALVYVSSHPEMLKRIDRAVALKLAPLAQAFAGVIVSNESAAIRGNDPTSRIIDPKIASFERPMGTCGQFGFCGLLAPIACYTCKYFQPWLDGPHENVLNALLTERERLLNDTDLRIAATNDRTILAVAQVVLKCNEMKARPAE